MAALIIRVVNSDDSFIGRAIDWVTDALYDHAELGTPEGTWIGAHADGGVQERAADYMKPTREARYSIPVTDAQLAAILGYARSKIGQPYNFGDIAGLLFHDRRLTTPQATICSQFVVAACWAGGVYLLNVQPEYDYLITPRDVHLSPVLIGRRILSTP